MNIKIICVGKIKEKFYRDAILEYSKRLSKYCKLQIIEVADEKTPDKISDHERELILDKEGQRLIKHINENDFVYALAIKGAMKDSIKFAKGLENLTISGKSTIDFVIGGSLGLSNMILNRADEQISFSQMTFPHQLMRVILTEQIYRAFRIINKEPYHK